MNDQKEGLFAIAGCTGIVILAIASILIGVGMDGWILPILWGWFIVPTFGLPALTFWQAIGIALVANYLTHQISTNKSEKGKEIETAVSYVSLQIGYPLFLLFLGWIAHSFMG